jgi:SAM-dependent methyltransferase
MLPIEPPKPPLISGGKIHGSYLDLLTGLLAARVGRAPKPLECLDLVCRDGATTLRLYESLPPGTRVVAVDPSRSELTKFHESIPPELNKLLFPRKDALMRLPFGDESFDLVWANLATQELPDDPKSLVRQAMRYVRPPGQLLLLVVLRDTVVDILKTVGSRIGDSLEGTQIREWMGNSSNLLTSGEWMDLVRKAGGVDLGVDRQQILLELDAPLAANPFMVDVLMPTVFGRRIEKLSEQLAGLDAAGDGQGKFSCSVFVGCVYARKAG